METKINLGENSRAVIKWKVKPIDYSHEAENNIIAKFAAKYGISKDHVKVEPVFINRTTEGTESPYVSGITENIEDPKAQQELFKQWIAEKEIEDVDFDKIIEIDNLINSNINYEVYEKHKKYTLKWIKWSNFMSYGPNNYFDFTKLKGLVLLSSDPANQGGKSTFCLDLFRFLLFGKVTLREDDWTLAKCFNRHLPEATEVVVEGCISIDGTDYVIKRTLTRPSLAKRTEKSKVTQKVNYYKLVNNEYIDLYDEENQESTTTTATNKVIKEAIGNERDFDLMICVTSKNLADLISLKDTERGRLVSRWIGLLPLEEKDALARDTFNKTIAPKLLLNRYNKEEVSIRISELEEENAEKAKLIKKLEKEQKNSTKKLEEYNKTKESLLESKSAIDENLTKIDVVTLETKLNGLSAEGVRLGALKKENEEAKDAIGNVDFNENEYSDLIDKDKTLSIEINNARNELRRLNSDVETLKKGEFCPTCGAKLANVNNSALIDEKNKQILEVTKNGKAKKEELDKVLARIEELKGIRDKFNQKNKLELLIAKNEVDLEQLRGQYRETKALLKDIEKNKTAIENNNKIEIALNNVKVNISTEEDYIFRTNKEIESNAATIKVNTKTIADNKTILETIEKEEKIVRNWKIYLEMVGKNGVCKMVLRNVLPFINGELHRLLNGVCNFDVEVGIDNHNDVAFYIVEDDGVIGGLGSGSGLEQTVASLALRSVLARISTFSKPSFVVFDEILGGVADENYDQVKLLYDKIVKDYEFIFQISHLKQIADWHTRNVVVHKENHISTITNE